jgi:hypothetical protein
VQVLGAIGEQFAEGEEVCGVAVNIRPAKDRVELWTRTAANEAVQTSIGKQFKQTLDLADSSRLGYVVFVSSSAAAEPCCASEHALPTHSSAYDAGRVWLLPSFSCAVPEAVTCSPESLSYAC